MCNWMMRKFLVCTECDGRHGRRYLTAIQCGTLHALEVLLEKQQI